jgi:hypothetical protein
MGIGQALVVATAVCCGGNVSDTASVEVTDESSSGGNPIFEDGFETGSHAPSSGGFAWGAARAGADTHGYDDVLVSSKISHSGSYSLEFLFGGDEDGQAWAEQRFGFTEAQTEVWLEYYLYVPDGTEGWSAAFAHRVTTHDGNKFFALWGGTYEGSDSKVLLSYRYGDAGPESRLYPITMLPQGWTRSHYEYEYYNIFEGLRGTWIQYRIYVKSDTAPAAGDGVLRVWQNGALRIDFTGTTSKTGASNVSFRNGYLLGWANSGFDEDTRIFIDDFKVWTSNPGW